MAAVTICSYLEPRKIVSHYFHCFPIYLPWSDGIACHDLSFLKVEFFKLIYFNWRLITLQYCSGFCHTLTWISHGCTCVPHPEPPPHLPPHPIPQRHPSAPALSTMSHTSNPDWKSVSHMVIYMFQCYSLKSSHPTFSHRVQKTALYICVSSAVLHIGSSLPSF